MQNSLLSYEQAEAILYFQMNGCLAINKRMIETIVRTGEGSSRQLAAS